MVVEDGYACEGPTAWLSNYNTALEELRHVDDTCDGQESWSRPSADTDKLYMSLGGGLNMFFYIYKQKIISIMDLIPAVLPPKLRID